VRSKIRTVEVERAEEGVEDGLEAFQKLRDDVTKKYQSKHKLKLTLQSKLVITKNIDTWGSKRFKYYI
jgi:hypothetical protein